MIYGERFTKFLRIGLWASPILAGLLSVQFGKSAGFDFLTYHYYNGFAALTHRMNFDVLPASHQTFFNPAADIFLYELISNLPPRLFGFTLGAIHGFNFVLTAVIASYIFPPSRSLTSQLLPILLAAAGFFGSINLGLLGSFHHDNLVSIFFLLSLLILCGPLQKSGCGQRETFLWLALAGALVGAGLGLKLTLAPFVLGIVAAPLCFSWPLSRRVGGMIICAGGIIPGFLLTAGFYALRMYRLFGNPFFPIASQLSTPPYDRFIDARDFRFLPNGVPGFLLHPFFIAFKTTRVSEFPFRDFRLPATYAVVLIFLAVLGWRLANRGRTLQPRPVWRISPPASVLLGVAAVSYFAWLWLLGLYRYALILELLSFVILAILLFDMLERKRALAALFGLAALIIPSTQRFGTRRQAWGAEPFVATVLPQSPRVENNALVLLVGADTGNYFIPAFASSVRFLGIDVFDAWPAYAGEFRGAPVPESRLEPFAGMMHRIADSHVGQVLLMYQANDFDRVSAALRSYHYKIASQPCGVIRSNVAAVPPLMLCALTRA